MRAFLSFYSAPALTWRWQIIRWGCEARIARPPHFVRCGPQWARDWRSSASTALLLVTDWNIPLAGSSNLWVMTCSFLARWNHLFLVLIAWSLSCLFNGPIAPRPDNEYALNGADLSVIFSFLRAPLCYPKHGQRF